MQASRPKVGRRRRTSGPIVDGLSVLSIVRRRSSSRAGTMATVATSSSFRAPESCCCARTALGMAAEASQIAIDDVVRDEDGYSRRRTVVAGGEGWLRGCRVGVGPDHRYRPMSRICKVSCVRWAGSSGWALMYDLVGTFAPRVLWAAILPAHREGGHEVIFGKRGSARPAALG